MPYIAPGLLILLCFDAIVQAREIVLSPPVLGVFELLEGFGGCEATCAKKAAGGVSKASMENSEHVQKRFVVVTRLGVAAYTRRCVIALFFAYSLEFLERLLLVVGKMAVVCGGVLERLDSLQISHDAASRSMESMGDIWICDGDDELSVSGSGCGGRG